MSDNFTCGIRGASHTAIRVRDYGSGAGAPITASVCRASPPIVATAARATSSSNNRCGGGRRRGRGCRARRNETDTQWVPCTKLGRLVQKGTIKSLEQIYLHSIPIKEFQIVEHILGPILKDEVMKIMAVQKQTSAGQRTRFKAFVVVGDYAGHVGLGVKHAKEVTIAIHGALNLAKMNLIPVRCGYWGSKIGKPHTISVKVTGKCGSVLVRLVPAPRGAGILAALTPKKVLQLAGVKDVYTCSRGHTATVGNFVRATYDALASTYGFLLPDLWHERTVQKSSLHDWRDPL